MALDDFQPIFGQPNTEWVDPNSTQLRPFLLYVHAPDSSKLRIEATDFGSNTWVALRTVTQLEDMVSLYICSFFFFLLLSHTQHTHI